MAKHDDQRRADETPDVSHIKNPDVTHEASDVNVKAVAWFIVGLAVSCAIIFVILRLLYGYFDRRELRAEEKPATLVEHGPQLPPQPRLQGIPGFSNYPRDDMEALRAKEEAQLKNYGWIDQTAGQVRIPIEQAMKLIAERGLPASSSGRAPERNERR